MRRRRFLRRGAELGFSAALVSGMVPDSLAANDNLLDSSPLAPNESPVTKERVEYLKSKPYKNTMINVMALRSAVGDCLGYYTARRGGGNGRPHDLFQGPIGKHHQQNFSHMTAGLCAYCA